MREIDMIGAVSDVRRAVMALEFEASKRSYGSPFGVGESVYYMKSVGQHGWRWKAGTVVALHLGRTIRVDDEYKTLVRVSFLPVLMDGSLGSKKILDWHDRAVLGSEFGRIVPADASSLNSLGQATRQ